MKTAVVMKRPIFNTEISQRTSDGFLSATDLVKAGNMWRAQNGMQPWAMGQWFQQKGTKEFISELSMEFGAVKSSGRGRGSHTWVHPLLFIDMSLAISPKLKVKMYKWIQDSLIEFRHNSGDSYRAMCASLYMHEKNKSMFQRNIMDIARQIRSTCGVADDWQHATEDQLKLRDRMHDTITTISNVLRHNDQAVELGIEEALKAHGKKKALSGAA